MSDKEFFIIKQEGVILKLKISPNSSKNQLILDGDTLKLKITAQPIEGKANKAVIEFLSKLFKVPKSYVEIVKGDTSKEKTILLKTCDKDKICCIQEKLNSL